MVSVARYVIKERPSDLSYITAELDGVARLNKILAVLDRAVVLGNSSGVGCAKPKAGEATEKGAKQSARGVAIVRELQQALVELEVGGMLAVPGGWGDRTGGHAIFYLWERTGEDTFAFIVCNTGQGVGNHPSTQRAFPKSKSRTAMRLEGIKRERLVNQDFLYILTQLQSTRKESNTPAVFYEVLLPYLCDGPITAAVARCPEELQGDFASLQKAGTCYYRCCLCVTRYLLKRFGFSPKQSKQFFYALRLGYMRHVLFDLRAPGLEARPLNDSDVRMVEMGMSQLSLAAVKLRKRSELSEEAMEDCHTLIGDIKAALTDAPRTGSAFSVPPVLDARTATALEPFMGFGIVADSRKTDGFAGGPKEAVPELFVDLMDEDGAELASWPSVGSVVVECVQRCNKLRAKTSVAAATLSMHQICALVEHTFTRVLPPVPRWASVAGGTPSAWVPAELPVQEQRDMLRALFNIMAHYVSAFKSVQYDRSAWGAYLVTVSSILIAFEHVVRLQSTDGDACSPVSQCMFKAPEQDLSLLVADMTDAQKRALKASMKAEREAAKKKAKEEGKALEEAAGDEETKREPRNVVAGSTPLFRLNAAAISGQTFEQLSERALVVDPYVAMARDRVLLYSTTNVGEPLFSNTNFATKNDSMDKYMQALVVRVGSRRVVNWS